MTLPIDPDPLTFNEEFDFSAGVEALSFNTSGDVELSIDPAFELTVGLRLSGGVDLADRFFIVDNDDPEVSIDVTAQLDDPVVAGSVGFLDVILQEQDLTENEGIKLTGSLTFDLDDPGSGQNNDGRIELGEISLGNLTSIVDPNIEAALDIDGLEIGVATSGVASGLDADLDTIRIALDGADAGKIDSLEALEQLPMTLLNSIEGLDDFLSFDNLSSVAVQLMLSQVGDWLEGVKDSSILQTEIPLTGKKLGDLVDVGQAFLNQVLNPLDNPTVLAVDLLKEVVLTEDATLSLKLNDTIDLSITVPAGATIDNVSIDDLVADFNAALDAALADVGLPTGLIKGAVRQGQLVLEAIDDAAQAVESLVVSAGDAALGFINDQIAEARSFFSIQDLFERLAVAGGGSFDAANEVLLFPLSFNEQLDTIDVPLNFALDLGAIASLRADSRLTIDAGVEAMVNVGIRTGPGLALEERFFIDTSNGLEPELSLTLRAQADDPMASGTIGFLGVQLAPQDPANTDGIVVDGAFTLNLVDPGTSTAGDGITLNELTIANLTTIVNPDLDLGFDIAPMEIKATGSLEDELGSLLVSLDSAGVGADSGSCSIAGGVEQPRHRWRRERFYRLRQPVAGGDPRAVGAAGAVVGFGERVGRIRAEYPVHEPDGGRGGGPGDRVRGPGDRAAGAVQDRRGRD